MRMVALLAAYSIIILILSLLCSHNWPEQQDTEIWGQGAAASSRVCRPGQTQRQLYLLPHCIKPIIHHQGLFSVTVNVLFALFKSVVSSNGVSSTAQTAEIVNKFFSPLQEDEFKKEKKKRLLREDLIPRRLSPGLCAMLSKADAKKKKEKVQLAECFFIFWPKSPWIIKLSLNLNKTIASNQSEFISFQIIYTVSWNSQPPSFTRITCVHETRKSRPTQFTMACFFLFFISQDSRVCLNRSLRDFSQVCRDKQSQFEQFRVARHHWD